MGQGISHVSMKGQLGWCLADGARAGYVRLQVEIAPVPWWTAGIGRLRVCNNDNARRRLKGIQIWGDRVHADGSTSFIPNADIAQLRNCAVWDADVLCPSNHLATGVVVHATNRNEIDGAERTAIVHADIQLVEVVPTQCAVGNELLREAKRPTNTRKHIIVDYEVIPRSAGRVLPSESCQPTLVDLPRCADTEEMFVVERRVVFAVTILVIKRCVTRDRRRLQTIHCRTLC